MPAHLRMLQLPVCNEDGCRKPAVDALYSTTNEPIGMFCGPHGAKRLRAFLAVEQAAIDAAAEAVRGER